MGAQTLLIWIRIEDLTGTFESGNEHSVSIKCEEFLD